LHKNCFFKTNIFLLLKYNKDNYIIDLQLNTKLLFKFLYILFKRKLAIFRNYLLENQTLKYISKSTNYINILILFVFKKDNTF